MPDAADAAAVESQLGRPPRGRWRVARRCACGLPQVIETHPLLEDGTPFPTLWWLTCKRFTEAVSRLEGGGRMAEINRRLSEEPDMRRELVESTERYVRARDALKILDSSGHPGGGPERVKCLHAHTAHHLVTGDNPIGRAVIEELDWTDPAVPCA